MSVSAGSCFSILTFFGRISRLFSDAKKILLYSQNDKSLDGFKELISAVKDMQLNTAGEYSRVQYRSHESKLYYAFIRLYDP